MESNNNNTTESIQKIKEFFYKVIDYLRENKLFVVFFIVAIVVVVLTYFYSESYRTNSKENEVLNNLTYTKPRDLVDFCGIDNNVVDKMFTGVTFNDENNSIKIANKNINLFDLGLSSEYVIFISGSEFNDGFYNIFSIADKHTILLDDSTKVKVAKYEEEDITQTRASLNNFEGISREKTESNIEITYYKPNSNINPYKYKKLTDYYISSSHRSFLVGFQKGDYCSLNMINRVIYLGARYIELEILNKEIKNETTPIVASGYQDGSVVLTLNHIQLKDCIELIAQMAFSESHIDNFNDPFFIFLNLKVGNNYNTKNEIARLIKANFGDRMLSRKYLNSNIGNASLCELKGKVVIFSSQGWKGSDLEEVVNSATDTPHLQRLTLHEIMNYSDRGKPKFSIRKNTIKFSKGATNSEIHFTDTDIDLGKLGVKMGDNLIIKGARNMKNNSGNFLFKVESFSPRKITMDKAVKLETENPGSMVMIDVYDASYRGNETSLEEYNKTNLTICVPDDRFLSSNYNPNEAMYMGCQFVTMNYQSLDTHMYNYFDKFMVRAFQMKPEPLTIEQKMPKSEGLGALTPSDKVSLDYDVDYSFITKYMFKTITFSTAAFPNLKLGVGATNPANNPAAKMILDGDDKEIEFLVVKGLDGKSDTVSFMVVDEGGSDVKKYLRYGDNCCFLTFDSLLSSSSPDYDPYVEREKMRQMSFIPLKSFTREDKYNSFGVIMRKKIGNETTEVMYYLKHRKNFTPKGKLFYKTTNSYNFRMILYENNLSVQPAIVETSNPDNQSSYCAVLRPTLIGNTNFLPLGDIVVKLDKLKYQGEPDSETSSIDIDNVLINIKQDGISSMVVNGAVAHPIDYELLFENRNFTESGDKIHYETGAQFSIWKPLAPDGFTALGVVFQNSYTKPKKDEIYCVSNDYITEEVYRSEFYTNVFDHFGSSINIWNRSLKNDTENNLGLKYYGVVKNVRETKPNEDGDVFLKEPNPIDYSHFFVDINPGDYNDRIYLDNVILNNNKDRNSCNFKVSLSSKKFQVEAGRRYDSLMKIDNQTSKLVSFNRNSQGGKVCMGLPQPYWSSYYKETESDDSQTQDNSVNSKLKGMSCGDSNDFGTNLKMYSDFSIRLADNNKYCVTHKKSSGKVNTDIDDENNFLYLDKCNRNLDNQMFLFDGDRLKVFSDGGAEEEACITISPDNEFRLERCGDQKFTALHLWENKIMRDDKCFSEDAEEKLKEISAIEVCDNNSYYVTYLDGIFKHEEFCSKREAYERYEQLEKNIGKTGVADVVVSHKGEIIRQSMTGEPSNPFKNEIIIVGGKNGKCLDCKQASRMLCSNQRMELSMYNSFNNFEEEQRLMKYCMKMRDVDDFRCGRANRQKYIHFPQPEDYCLQIGKYVYIQFPDVLSELDISHALNDLALWFNRIDTSSPKTQLPVQNLLGEHYTDNYTVFLKAMLKTDTNDKTKYKILFDKSNFENMIVDENKFDNVSLLKKSEFICLDYKLKPQMIKVGSKVLVYFSSYYPSGNGTTSSVKRINKEGIKYLGVVIKKHSDKYYRVMLSLNSYESNYDKKIKVGIKYYESNPVIDVSLSEMTLFNRVETCLT